MQTGPCQLLPSNPGRLNYAPMFSFLSSQEKKKEAAWVWRLPEALLAASFGILRETCCPDCHRQQCSSGIERVCLDILVQARAFSDKQGNLRVKNIVIYLTVEKNRWNKMPFKKSTLPQGVYTQSFPKLRKATELFITLLMTRQTSFAKDNLPCA